ncbi:hypothetical protein [Brachybacterium sp. GPGPB12]|uniref:hypothetical protein n=1 Tax=Brachybacterium sp. GPGPB12 TaxID=3023517 RepID=UPI0031345F5A
MSAPRPESLRDVSLENSLHDDGTAFLRITGPIPEILDLARRLDRSAKTVQARQRRALEEGEPIPFDLDGDVARGGKAMSQAARATRSSCAPSSTPAGSRSPRRGTA